MASGTPRTSPCGAGQAHRFQCLILPLLLLFIAALISVPVTSANSEAVVEASTDGSAAPEAQAAEADAGGLQSPETAPDPPQPETVPIDEATRDRSSLAAVYNASSAQQSPSQQPHEAQTGVGKRRAQLLALVIFISIVIFLLNARVRLSELRNTS